VRAVAEIDDELIARAIRWCAEAGRQAAAQDVRAALAPLSWDELLAVRALLADPPPSRPLGPHALVDLARGLAPDLAAERQREGRYRDAEAAGPPVAGTAPADAAPAAPRAKATSPRPRRGKRPAPLVIRRARDRAEPSAPAAPQRPGVDELFRPEGRAVLERLVRRHGGRRARIEAELAAGWRRGDGGEPGAAELEALLETHGLARAFARRERDEAIHAARAAGGSLARAAAALGTTPEELPALLARVGAAREVEAIRERRRDELRARATLAERARLVAEDGERLADLGLLAELEDDLRARLPEHLRALRAAGERHLPSALARTLALEARSADAILRRLGLDAAAPAPAPAATASTAPAAPRPAGVRPPARTGGSRPFAPRERRPAAGSPPRGGRTGRQRPSAPRPATPGSGPPRTGGGRPAPPATRPQWTGGAPPVPAAGGRPPRTGGARPSPAGGRPAPHGGARPPRTGGGRPGLPGRGPRPDGRGPRGGGRGGGRR
jgi:hypothetical protein